MIVQYLCVGKGRISSASIPASAWMFVVGASHRSR
jgi:hypothetical protein